MSPALDAQLTDNLRRWEQTGAARRWVEARLGRWDHDAWVALLEDLRHSPCWPLDPEALGRALEEARERWQNLRRWERSGQPRRWVADHEGRWGEAEWSALLQELTRSAFWPLDPEAVGEVLEELAREWRNARRWLDSGAARQWLGTRGGVWHRADWPVLREALRQAGFWPVDPAAAEEVLALLLRENENLRRWLESGAARTWVAAHRGSWGHADWVALQEDLRRSPFWPVDVGELGRLLEDLKLEWWNLRRWRVSGLARRWVEARGGEWGQVDWLALPHELRGTGFWPVDPVALGRVLEEVRQEWRNLRRWEQSGQPRRWRAAREGRWDAEEWEALLGSLRASEFWPLDPEAVRRLLEGLGPPASRTAA
jgi:hypothetical protein